MAKGLDRERIVAAALDVLDDRGIDAVTVRNVATRLDVKAPALYWHVRNKQELLDEMGTEIHRRVAQRVSAEPTRSWPDSLVVYGRALRAEYLAHRDGARTFSGTRLTDPDVLRAQEPLLSEAVGQGVALESVVLAAELVTAFVVGFVIEEQERSQSGSQRYSLEERSALVGEEFALVAAAGAILYGDPDVRFEHHLTGIVENLRGKGE